MEKTLSQSDVMLTPWSIVVDKLIVVHLVNTPPVMIIILMSSPLGTVLSHTCVPENPRCLTQYISHIVTIWAVFAGRSTSV